MFSQNSAGSPDSAGKPVSGNETPSLSRSSIPEELLRPRRGEAPRYPVDTVIGALGQGDAPEAAYRFARNVCAALAAGNTGASALASINRVLLESYISALETVSPRGFRIGSGREEPDGAISFLVRFIGREQGMTGELFVRLEQQPAAVQPAESAVPKPEQPPPAEQPEPAPPAESRPVKTVWVFEELILEEARSREDENAEDGQRFDFSPYQRFF